MQRWGRLITAMVTPFDPAGKLSVAGSVELAKKLAAEGSTALVLSGTTGESPTLTDEEKLELFQAVKEAVTIPIIANVGGNNTEKSVRFTEKVKPLNLDGVMAVVPYYNKPNKAGLLAHFGAIAEAGQMPLLIYNVPGRTGSNMDADITLKVAELPYVVAIKEATGEFEKISRIIKEAPPGFSVYTGEDNLTLPLLAIGGYGVVSVAGNVVSRAMRAMIEHYVAGRVQEAKELHLALTPIYKSLFATTNPIPVKAALKLVGFDAGPLRLPMVEADETVVALVKKDLDDLAKWEGTV